MKTRTSRFAVLASAASTVALSVLAAAQPSPSGGQMTITHPAGPGGTGSAPAEPLVVHDPYSESAHFVVRHLQLEGHGPTLQVQPGTTIHASIEINEHCSSCATPHNHILVGFQGQQTAAACAWSGMRESGGWRTQQFTMIAPMRPGVYPLRVRGASSSRPTCDDETMSYWTRDLPGGPGPEATIGVVVVENPRPVPSTPASTVAPVPTTTSSATTTTTGVGPSGGPLTTTVATTTVTSTTSVATAPSSIANGSFEQPDVAQGQSIPMAQILGWTRSFGNGVEVHDRTRGAAASGDQWVELDGTDSSGISAEVATVPGGTYMISLAFAPRPGTSIADNRLEIRWNGELVGTVAASGESAATAQWTRVTVRVHGIGSSGRLELRDAGTSNGIGTFVDDVTVARSN